MGDGKHIVVKGKGTIAILTCSNTIYFRWIICLEIDQNLLSVGQLIEKGFKVVFMDTSCLKVSMKGKSFTLNPLVKEQIAFPAKGNVTNLWQKRLGHYHYQGLLQMKSKEKVNGLPD